MKRSDASIALEGRRDNEENRRQTPHPRPFHPTDSLFCDPRRSSSSGISLTTSCPLSLLLYGMSRRRSDGAWAVGHGSPIPFWRPRTATPVSWRSRDADSSTTMTKPIPRALRETSQPPFGLFARGTRLDPECDCVAVVGTRVVDRQRDFGRLRPRSRAFRARSGRGIRTSSRDRLGRA